MSYTNFEIFRSLISYKLFPDIKRMDFFDFRIYKRFKRNAMGRSVRCESVKKYLSIALKIVLFR